MMPAPVDGITLKGRVIFAPKAVNLEVVDCDDEETVPSVDGDTVTISWAAVTMSHPDLGGKAIVPVTIHNYEVVVERELEVNGEEFASVFSIILPPGQTSMTIPAEFLGPGDGEKFKYEVLAREESFNQTAVESCFVLE